MFAENCVYRMQQFHLNWFSNISSTIIMVISLCSIDRKIKSAYILSLYLACTLKICISYDNLIIIILKIITPYTNLDIHRV